MSTFLVSGSIITSGNATVNGTFSSPNPFYSYDVCQGRLTLTSGLAVTITDVSGAGTLYFTPYKGSYIALYSGTVWQMYQFSEVNISLATLAVGCYDVFANGSGTSIVLSLVAWTNNTIRSTGLVLQNGVYVLSGTSTKRYLGTTYVNATGVTSDSLSGRYVWNYYNRVQRNMAFFPSATWTYAGGSFRQANANSTYQLNFILGLQEDNVFAKVSSGWLGAANSYVMISLGINSTTVVANTCVTQVYIPAAGVANQFSIVSVNTYGQVGLNYVAWLENCGASTSFWGANGPSNIGGMDGSLFC